jgi:UDP-glucose 4-epimerase
MFSDKHILITGGTGSLGNALAERLLQEKNPPECIEIFSRDEAKQHAMRLRFQNLVAATDDIIYSDFKERVKFTIGDIRDLSSVKQAVKDTDIIFHTAAMKQVPTAEYFPHEAFRTNVVGAENIVSSIIEGDECVECVVGISTDKACYPINAYGTTKALMERIFIAANMRCDTTRFVLARYGNIMGSTGSVIPLFQNQIINKNPVTITDTGMTRFMMDIQQATDLIFESYDAGDPGDIFVPVIPSARIVDVATLMSDNVKIVGIRPGEKLHETLITSEESNFTISGRLGYIIKSMLPELCGNIEGVNDRVGVYTSAQNVMGIKDLRTLLVKHGYVL